MPEDKDFKRLVRARMAETGERYTEARSQLRPEDPSPRVERQPARFPVRVIPLGLEELLARRPRPGSADKAEVASPGSRWQLTLELGGRLDALPPGAVALTALGDLGALLTGVPFVAFGVDLLVPAPPGTDRQAAQPPSMDTRREAIDALGRAQAQLHDLLRDELGLELPNPHWGQSGGAVGRPRQIGGQVVLPGRLRTALYLGDETRRVLGTLFDPFAWLGRADVLPGPLWSGFGLVLDIDQSFPTRELPTRPGPQFAGSRRAAPDVSEEFWSSVLGRSSMPPPRHPFPPGRYCRVRFSIP